MIVHYVVPFGVVPGLVAFSFVLIGRGSPRQKFAGAVLLAALGGFSVAVLLAGGTLERLLS